MSSVGAIAGPLDLTVAGFRFYSAIPFPHVGRKWVTQMAHMISVDVSTLEAEAQFERTIEALKNAGWTIGDTPGQIGIVENEAEPATPVVPTIIRCQDPKHAQAVGAITPDTFAILEGLSLTGIETTLAESVPRGIAVDRVVIGFNWTLVRAGDLCGIARSPSRGTEGARTIRPDGGFAGQDLRNLAGNLKSLDPLRRSLGLAAVNAYWNRVDVPDAARDYVAPRGGLASIEAPGDGAIIIGGFRGALKRLPKARIVEREPKPGDIPVNEAPEAYKSAETLAITAQTLMNGSLAPILAASHSVPQRILVGPSCPACPALFDHGIDEVFGAVIKDPDAAESFIVESGTMIMLDHIATNRTLRRN